MAKHSTNQRKIGYENRGELRVNGRSVLDSKKEERRKRAREERRQVLYDSVTRVFNGNASEGDILTIILYSDEFERPMQDSLNSTLLDVTGLKSTEASFGEPALFRRKEG